MYFVSVTLWTCFERAKLRDARKMTSTGQNPYQRQVLHLLERVGQPLYVPRGNGTVFFKLPDDHIPDEYKESVNAIESGEAGTRASGNESGGSPFVYEVPSRAVPDLSLVKAVPRGIPFSYFIRVHREAADELTSILLQAESYEDLLALAALVRDQVNEQLYVHSFVSSVIRSFRKFGGSQIRVPPVWEILPDKFFENEIFRQAQANVAVATNLRSGSQQPIIINRSFASTDRNPENRLAYFREDLGINTHHWHWHLIYTVSGTTSLDRHGELFYYMHQQMLARYELERNSVNLPRLKPIPELDWDGELVDEGYFPKLTMTNSGIIWGSRPPGMRLTSIDIPDAGYEVAVNLRDLELFTSRVLHAIHSGFVENAAGQKIALDPVTGIDILGNLIEANGRSINGLFYGDLHNQGHTLFSFLQDPEHAHMENMGVIGDTATAMRDPLFYRWHKFINELFLQYKATLQPYRQQELTFEGINIASIEVVGSTGEQNVLLTGWQESDVELTRGLDFNSPNPVFARVTHLQHEEFNYVITVENTTNQEQSVTFRIFLGPTRDRAGNDISLREQRLLMIEMDKFVKKVGPGTTTIERSSSASSVTIPFEQTFRQLERVTQPSNNSGLPADAPTSAQENYCGCGWPDHMLLPRGTPGAGTQFKLFVMATDWKLDAVGSCDSSAGTCMCSRNAASFCGILDDKYPDKRSMGFPFDRSFPRATRTLENLLTPNMKTADVRIVFQDEVIRRFPEDDTYYS